MPVEVRDIVRNPVKEKLARGEVVSSMTARLVSSIEIVRIAKSAGFDSLYIDLEHSSFSMETTSQICVMALEAGIPALVRVPANTPEYISRVLDGGALGVIAPGVRSAGEARAVVAAAKYPPLGERGLSAGLPQLQFRTFPAAETLPALNDATLVIVQFESKAALEAMDEIVAVDGVDLVLIGTNDLMVDLGIPGQYDHPKVRDAYERTIALAARGDGALIGVAHLGMVVLPGNAEVHHQVVGPDQHQVDAVDRDDLLHRLERRLRLELDDHQRRVVERGQGLRRGKSAELQLRQPGRQPALAERRILRRRYHCPCLPGRAHPRRYYPERPAVEHARDVLRRIRRHAHQRRDPRLERHDADLAGRLHGEARVLQVDVERVEPRALGDAHDLDARYQPRGHRRHQLATRELLPDWIADDVADLDRHADASLAEEAGLPLDGGGLRRGEEPEQSLRALRLPGGNRDAA